MCLYANVKGIILLPFLQVSGKETIFLFIAEMSSKGVPTISISLKNQNLNWSLKPIKILMTVLGQEMVINNNQVKSKRQLIRFILIFALGLVILLINFIINGISFAKVWSVNLNLLKRGGSPIGFLNVIVGHLFHDLMIIGIPLFFILMRILTCRWKDILISLETIQSEMNLSGKMHQKLRNYAFLAIFLFVLVTLTVCWGKCN